MQVVNRPIRSVMAVVVRSEDRGGGRHAGTVPSTVAGPENGCGLGAAVRT